MPQEPSREIPELGAIVLISTDTQIQHETAQINPCDKIPYHDHTFLIGIVYELPQEPSREIPELGAIVLTSTVPKSNTKPRKSTPVTRYHIMTILF
jgi:hypothetical protein